MNKKSNIYPVSDFNRKTGEHIKRIQETKKPEVLTVDGKAAIILVDPETYNEMVKNQKLLETLKTIALANEQHENGQSKPTQQVFKELKDELKAMNSNINL